MGKIMIKCPSTGKDIPTGMEADKTAFELSDYKNHSVMCPVCGKSHNWSKKDAWLVEGLQAGSL